MVRGVEGTEDSLESSAKPEEWQNLESSAKPGVSHNNSMGSSNSGDSLESCAKPEDSHANAHAHPISHPQECPEAFARIGLVADGVGPKKPKTSESQQPRPVVGPLLGVVRAYHIKAFLKVTQFSLS